jgi:hypothetical protein
MVSIAHLLCWLPERRYGVVVPDPHDLRDYRLTRAPPTSLCSLSDTGGLSVLCKSQAHAVDNRDLYEEASDFVYAWQNELLRPGVQPSFEPRVWNLVRLAPGAAHMNRNLIVGALAIAVVVLGYLYYQEQQKSGIAISVGKDNLSIETK